MTSAKSSLRPAFNHVDLPTLNLWSGKAESSSSMTGKDKSVLTREFPMQCLTARNMVNSRQT
jgi:hypothetical protein